MLLAYDYGPLALGAIVAFCSVLAASIPTWLTVRSNRKTFKGNKLDHGMVVQALTEVTSGLVEVKSDIADVKKEVIVNREEMVDAKADIREIKQDVRILHGDQTLIEAQVVQLMQDTPHEGNVRQMG